MSKRKNGEGTYRRLPSGRWNVQLYLDGRRLSHTADTERECRTWARRMAAQIERGMPYEATRTRFGDFLDGWLELKAGDLRTATIEQYRRTARLYIKPNRDRPGLGDYKLQELTPAVIQRFYRDLQRRGVGARTIQVVHGVIHGCLQHALEIEVVTRNAASSARKPAVQKREMQVWMESQVSQFLVSIAGARNENLYYLGFGAGMRRGELLALKWEDIDWGGYIRVRRQVVEPEGGGFYFAEPKTGLGRRSIEIGPNLLERLREQMERVDVLRRRPSWQEHGLVFPSAAGTPQNGYNVSKDFTRLTEHAGLPRIRFHDIRHTAASLMLQHGIPPVIVAGILGHSLAVLMSTYAHFIPSSQGEAARLMDALTHPEQVDLVVNKL